jgi:cellulose synthase/poly-beta-1,6-N-acetylglucosamine synthase-like glycosyltransferase
MIIVHGMMFFVWALGLSATILGTWHALLRLHRTPPHLDAPFALYPVSVLKPLKGNEGGHLKENLESFFKIDYPEFELIFSVASFSDSARPVVEALMEKYPHISARLMIGAVEVGPNPKVNNLVRSYESAKSDLLLISDSNVRVEPGYIRRVVAHLESGVGIVTAVVAGRNPIGMGAHLEAMYLNTFYARYMLMAEGLKMPCVVGKSMLMSRAHANRFGGIRMLGQYLAEDYMAGIAMQKLGLRSVIMSDPIHQEIGEYSVKDFWKRHTRWGRLRKSQAPVPFFFEPLFGAIINGIIGASVMNTVFNIPMHDFLIAHLLIWAFCDLLQVKRLGSALSVPVAFTWFLREIIAVPMWIHVASGNSVQWRGRTLHLKPGGLLETVGPTFS